MQTVGKLEDSMDGEGMMRTEAMHKASFYSLEKDLRKFYPNMLPIGAGCCIKCKTCTCPDAPCRFPDQAFPQWKPMECWSCRFVRQTTLTIIMVLERLRMPAVIY